MRAALLTAVFLLACAGGASALNAQDPEIQAHHIKLWHILSDAMQKRDFKGCDTVRMRLSVTRGGRVSVVRLETKNAELGKAARMAVESLRLPPPPKEFSTPYIVTVPFRFHC